MQWWWMVKPFEWCYFHMEYLEKGMWSYLNTFHFKMDCVCCVFCFCKNWPLSDSNQMVLSSIQFHNLTNSVFCWFVLLLLSDQSSVVWFVDCLTCLYSSYISRLLRIIPSDAMLSPTFKMKYSIIFWRRILF